MTQHKSWVVGHPQTTLQKVGKNVMIIPWTKIIKHSKSNHAYDFLALNMLAGK